MGKGEGKRGKWEGKKGKGEGNRGKGEGEKNGEEGERKRKKEGKTERTGGRLLLSAILILGSSYNPLPAEPRVFFFPWPIDQAHSFCRRSPV